MGLIMHWAGVSPRKTYMQLRKHMKICYWCTGKSSSWPPVWILKKDPGDLLSMPIRMGGIISDSSLDPLVSRARTMILFCCFKVQAVSNRYVCCLYPPWLSWSPSKSNGQVAVCQLPSQIYLATGDATNGKVWVNGIRLKCLWVFWRVDFYDPRSKHLDPLVDATARNLKDIQMPHFPPKHRFPFPACGILQGSHKGSGHQLELAVLFEIPALVHLGHEDLQVDTNDTMFMTLVHLIWWKYSETCLSL